MPDPSPFRSAFTDAQWERLVQIGTAKQYASGTNLLRRGDPPGRMFIVRSGELEAIDPRSSPPTVLAVFTAGTVLGEMSFADGSPVSVDVRVRQAATCLQLSIAALRFALKEDPDLDAAFHRGLTATLVRRTRRLTSTAVTSSMIPRSDEVGDTMEIALAQTTGGAARRVHMLMARGLDPHTATAIADQRYAQVEVPITTNRVRIGSGADCDIVLPDLRVAEYHAELVRTEGQWRVVSTCSRAVVVDGNSVSSAPLEVGSSLQVGRYALTLHEDAITVAPPSAPFYLHASNLGRDVAGVTLLDGVSFSAMAGEVIALIGPSGAGKTTLLDALKGQSDRGSIRMDTADFTQLLRANPAIVGEVPQDDIVLPELTVEESLNRAAQLRLAQATSQERTAVVNRVIEELGLDPIRHSRIGDPEQRGISGGQRKRVNIAQEVLTQTTRVLFLDEPTSGLDPRSAGDIARLARRLADRGTIVVMVTHDVSDSVLSQVDHLLVLVPGGRLAWFGPASDACEHFRCDSPAQIFDRLNDRTPQEWADHYKGTLADDTWCKRRRELAPEMLQTAPAPSPTRLPSIARQWAILTSNHARVKLRDRSAGLVLLAQPILVALVMMLVFPHPTSGLVFLLVLSCFWFGMSAAVRELIADRVVWRRERRLGLSTAAWVGSRTTVTGTAVALQCIGLSAVAWLGSGLDHMGTGLLPLIGAALLTGWAGLGTGLLVSAAWRRSEAAVGTIVLLLVPQIAFSGILMPLDQTRSLAQLISWVTPVRYAFQLALGTTERLQYLRLGEWYERPISGELFLMGLRPSGEGSLGLPTEVLVAVLVFWTLATCAAATAIEARRRG